MIQLRLAASLALGVAIGVASPACGAHAAIIRYEFSGYVQPIVLPLPAGSPGYSFTTLSVFDGYIQYDQATTPFYDDGTQAAWDLTSGVETYLTNGIETFSSTQAMQMGVWTYPDLWDVLSGIAYEPPLEPTEWQLSLTFGDGPDPFPTPVALPGANLTLADFGWYSSTLYVAGAEGYGNPWAIPLRLTALQGHVVSEPAQSLTALGLLALVVANRLRSQRAL